MKYSLINKNLVLKMAVVTAMLSPSLTNLSFAQEYNGESMPEDAAPSWLPREKNGLRIENGSLIAELPAEQRSFYALGSTSQGKAFGKNPEAWPKEIENSFVEFKVEGKADHPETEFFMVRATRADQKGWAVKFFPGSIQVLRKNNRFSIDTSKPDVYRMEFVNGRMNFSGLNAGVIAENVDPSPMDHNAIYFGSMTRDNKSGGSMSWKLDFIRWGQKDQTTP